MRAEKISLIIDGICKKEGIKYSSTNPHLVTLQEDAQKMADIYLQLKIILGDIKGIEERHNINGLRDKFETLITELDKVDHIVIRLAKELGKEND
jgi:hypothetical protein